MDSGTSTANFLTCMSGDSGLKGCVSLLKITGGVKGHGVKFSKQRRGKGNKNNIFDNHIYLTQMTWEKNPNFSGKMWTQIT